MRRVLKIFIWILGSIIVLLLAISIWLNTPYGKNFVRNQALSFLRKKLKTEVYIGEVGYGLPKYVSLKNVLLKDQAGDTLLEVANLRVQLDMLALLHNKLDVQEIRLDGLNAHIYRNLPDTNFNFTYIINAFAGSKTDKPKDTSQKKSSFKIDIKSVVLNNIHARFDDHTGGILLATNLDQLNLKIKEFDLDKLKFRVADLSVINLKTIIHQDTSLIPTTTASTKSPNLNIVADNIELNKILLQYSNSKNKFLLDLDLGKLKNKTKNFSLAEEYVDVDNLELDATTVKMVLGKNSSMPQKVPETVDSLTKAGWSVNTGNLKISNVNFIFDDENIPHQSSGIDYKHLNIQNFAITATNALYTEDTILGNLKHFSLKEQSGLDVKELKTKFAYTSHGSYLHNLQLQTDNSIIRDFLEIRYPSFEALKNSPQLVQLKVDLNKTVVGVKDMLVFAPQLNQQEFFRKNKSGRVLLDAKLFGTLNAVNISNLHLVGAGNTEIQLNGTLKGIPDSKKINYNFNIVKLQSTGSFVKGFIPPSVDSQFRIPDNFNIRGHILGTIKDYGPDLTINTSDGDAYVKGYVYMSGGSGRERYDITIHTQQLNAGHLLRKDSLLGKVTANITATGSSFDVHTMNNNLTASIESAYFKGYNYNHISLNGKTNSGLVSFNLKTADSNLRLALTGIADMSKKYPAIKADMQMDSVDLRALKLYATELRMHGKLHFDFPELNPDYPKGVFIWNEPVIVANGQRFMPDSLYILSTPSEDTGQNIVCNFDIFRAVVRGKTPISKIGSILQDHISRHEAFINKDSTKKQLIVISKKAIRDTTQVPKNYDLQLTASLIDKPLLHGILPGLVSMETIHIDAKLDPRMILVNATAPDIEYNGTIIENAKVRINGADSSFNYAITADHLSQSSMQFWYIKADGLLDTKEITANVQIADSVKKEKFALKASLQNFADSQVLQMLPGLKLNYKDWTVAQPNRIIFSNGKMNVQNFRISRNDQYISAASEHAGLESPLKIDINNFSIANITEIISTDTLLANGMVNGNVTIEKFVPSLQFTCSVKVKDMAFKGDTLGDITADMNNNTTNAYTMKATIQGRSNDVLVNGNYYTQTTAGNDINADISLNALNIKTIEGLTFGQIKSSKGYVKGKLHVQGSLSSPEVTGELHTEDLSTIVTQLNSYFKMPAEKIEFTGKGVNFSNFKIYDSAGDYTTLNGQFSASNPNNMHVQFEASGKNMRFMHSTATNNKVIYGDLYMSANLDIRGKLNAMKVDGNINILKGTDLTVVLPEDDPTVENNKGIVEFVNFNDSDDKYQVLALRPKKDTVKHVFAGGNDINVNIAIDKHAEFNLVIDQASGDFLKVRGEAALNTAMGPGGAVLVSGTYELHEGVYQFNYNFIKRRFNIIDGSTITFSGDPLKAKVDITAAYLANIPPYDLVQREVSDQNQLNYYKERIPFSVDLHLKGEIMKPGITFNIELPENTVYPISYDAVELVRGKLNQLRTDTSELNKQVFAVLILNHFVADDPLQSGASSSAGFIAKQSVSRFVGEQLNQFANGLVKGVDLSVDLASSEDYTSGSLRERTDLNLAASKRLLNDRLKVTIGNDFELEGPQTSNSDQNNYIPSNLATDYLLSPDGKYTVRAYRKNYDAGVLQGYVTETGLNFMVNLDYNHIKNIFRKKKKQQPDTTSKEAQRVGINMH